MAELVGGAFLSSFLNVLFDRMASRPFLDFISGKKKDNELLMRKLKLKLLTANKLVDDAEEKQMTSSNVRKWLDDLKDAIYCVGELLDEINAEALRPQLEGDDDHSPAGSSSTSWISRSKSKPSSPSDEFHNSLEPKISNIVGVLNLILDERDALGLKEGVQHRSQQRSRQTTSRVDESGVFGREKDREKILEALRSDNTTGPKIGVLPIVGMGGIGKSTLAQLVYKDVKGDFHERAWVFVGEEFDILQITRTIYGKITKNPCTITDLDLLSEELEKVLVGKKFLFVLDDVWNEDYDDWNKLMTHFNSCGVHGSKIIVTTRLGRVASITGTLSAHYLEKISEDDSCLLFASVVGSHPCLEVVGRQIVKKCQGLPLATKSIGGRLHSVLNPNEWEKILKSDLWELPKNKVLPALWLSYQYLPPHVKRCFAYCAIFPKGYNFESSKLILLWMAEDLLQPQEEEVLEEVGSDYFDILVSRSFFQHSIDENGESCFTMHDLINDLAKFVSGEFCLRLEDDHRTVERNICRTRHVSFMGFDNQSIQNFGALQEAKHLHTLLRLPSVSYDISQKLLVDLLRVLPCLRVLNLSRSRIVELPSPIGKLKQLRYLDVSGTSITELPDTVCTLYNLQTLLLDGCRNLIQLPSNLGRLINLRHLNIQGARQIIKMPAGMCNLKNLQTLSHFVVDKQTAQGIGELKKLQHLRQKLTISGVDNIGLEENALEADITSNMEYLDELVLTWGSPYVVHETSDRDPKNDREVLNKLQPHKNLKRLVIDRYGGSGFPGWLGDPYFSQLVSIRLTCFGHCDCLPPLGQLSSLEELCIDRLPSVVEIGSEFYGNDTPFRSLQKLSLINMSKWEKWSYYDGSRGNTNDGTIMFPNLCNLELTNCPELTEILPLEKLQSLEMVQLCGLLSFTGSLSHVESTCPKFLSLTSFHIEECPNFECFPNGGMDAPKLESLCINLCEKLRSLPEQMHILLPSLQRLSVVSCPEVESFPQGEGIMFPNLRRLELHNCPKLTEILPLEKLSRLESVQLRKLKSFSGSLAHVESECPKFLSLAHLEMNNCPNFVCFPDGGMDAPVLEKLYICECKKLSSLPKQMHTLLPSLQKLEVFGCPGVESFPDGGLPSNLQDLRLDCCGELAAKRSLWGLTRLKSLRKLEIKFSEGGEEMGCSFPEEGLLPTTLTSLSIQNHPTLTTIQGNVLRQLTSLESLKIDKCPRLQCFPEEAPKSLEQLIIWDCPKIGCFSGEWFPTSLSQLEIQRCPLLKKRFRKGTGEDWLQVAHIPRLHIV